MSAPASIADLRRRARQLADEAGKLAEVEELVEITKIQVTTPDGRPVWFPGDSILTRKEVAQVLAVSERTVREWPIRVAFPAPSVARYLFRDVIAFLNSHAA